MDNQRSNVPTIIERANAAPDLPDRCNVFNIKDEPGDTELDIKPALHERAYIDYTSDQRSSSIVPEDIMIADDGIDPILYNRVKEESVEDKSTGYHAPQESLLEHPSTCTVAQSIKIHEERLGSFCRVALTRLDTFQCKVCDAVYTDKQKLLQHVQEVHQSGPRRSLHLHVKSQRSNARQQRAVDALHPKDGTQSKSLRYKCDKCLKTYRAKRTLIKHCRRAHGTVSHRCTQCKRKFKCKEYLNRHVRNVHCDQQGECTVCKKMFRSGESLRAHVARHNGRFAGSKPVYICDYCQKSFTLKGTVQAHITNLHTRIGENAQMCDVCGISVKLLKKHIRNVHSYKPWQCKLCGGTMKSRHYLREHLKDFHGQKSADYICDYCQKIFHRREGLVAHIENMHGNVLYRCSVCRMEYKCKSYLKVHKSIMHSKEKYECKPCKKTFKNKLYYNTHVRLIHRKKAAGTSDHSESRPQSACRKCGKEFGSKQNRRKHERRWVCTRSTVSDKGAVASTSRKQHKVVIVKEEPADGEVELGPTVFQHMDCNYRPYKQEPQLD